MHSSKLFQVFNSFSNKEFSEFIKYCSVRIDSRSVQEKFLELILKHKNNLNSKNLNKEVVFKNMFPNAQYKDVKIRELISEFYKYARAFLAKEEFINSEFMEALFLLKQLRKKKLNNIYEIELKKLKKAVDKGNIKDAEFYRKQFLIAEEQHVNEGYKQTRNFNKPLQDLIDQLDIYYLSMKMRSVCEMQNYERIIGKKYKYHLLDELIDIVEKKEDSLIDVPSINIYHMVHRILKDQKDEDYISLKNEILKHKDSFSKSELFGLYTFLSNFCIQKCNRGENKYLNELFDIYKLLLKNELLLENNVLKHTAYKNIVSLACRIKEYKWAKSFIEDYKDHLLLKYKENAYNYNRAYLLCELEKNDETLALLNSVEFTDSHYAIDSKFILLKTYYALDEKDALEYFLISFFSYLKRNKDISENYRKGALNFLSLFKKISQTNWSKGVLGKEKFGEKVKDLELSVKEKEPVLNKTWLLEKVEELRQG